MQRFVDDEEAVTWLLTGGAGYIGAHVLRVLRAANLAVVVLDDLSTGVRSRVPPDVPLVEASVLDHQRVLATMREHNVRGVVHLAAKKAVGDSVERPLYYFRENVSGFERLLAAMGEVGVDRMVFSSSAAVFGTPDGVRVTEQTPARPQSPYGQTKLICEWVLQDVAAATGLRYASLRYFNVAGAGGPELGDTGTGNLIPLVFQALTAGVAPQVFGDDYPTRDGSCIRDYIHVSDLARAHLAALRRLEAGPCTATYNVGRGAGVTVKEVMEAVRKVVGRDFAYVVTGRRPGDVAQITAAVDLIHAELGWKAEHDLDEMVRSAWQAWQHTTTDPAP
jgi:UDP-glucose 4-epimerase